MRAEDNDRNGAPLVGRLEALIAVALVGLIGLVLGVAALSRSTSEMATGQVAYQQNGSFSYTGHATHGSVYGHAGVKTGDPILANSVSKVATSFAYQLTTNAAKSVSANASLVATVKLGQGLSRHFVLHPTSGFHSSTFTVSGDLPVGQIVHYVNTSNAALGSSTVSAATVSVLAKVSSSGSLGGRPLDTTFSATLPFSLNGDTLSLVQTATGPPGTPSANVLRPTQSGGVKYPTRRTNTLSLLVAHPSVALAREIGFGIVALCLLVGMAVGRPLLRSGGTPSGERERIRALYGSLLVPVNEVVVPGAAISEVSSIGSLAEIAKRYESMILHRRTGAQDEYMVWDNGMLYRYESRVINLADISPADNDSPAFTSSDKRRASGGSRAGSTRAKRRSRRSGPKPPERLAQATVASPASEWLANLYVTSEAAGPRDS